MHSEQSADGSEARAPLFSSQSVARTAPAARSSLCDRGRASLSEPAQSRMVDCGRDGGQTDPRWWNTRRFDALELLLLLLFGAVSGAMLERFQYRDIAWVARSAAQDTARLRDQYGPARNSENEEEWIIRDFFKDQRAGVFVDVGANHYRIGSNTFYLESQLDWSGIAVDPQTEFAAAYHAHRPRTRFFSYFVSDRSDDSVAFYLVPDNPRVASADRQFAEEVGTGNPMFKTQPVTVPTIRLTDLLDRAGVTHIDLLSVDVELAEPKVLAGFSIARFMPALVCIEAQSQVRQSILDYFAANGYVLEGRYLRADPQNLYFSPLRPAPPSPAVMSGAPATNATPR